VNVNASYFCSLGSVGVRVTFRTEQTRSQTAREIPVDLGKGHAYQIWASASPSLDDWFVHVFDASNEFAVVFSDRDLHCSSCPRERSGSSGGQGSNATH